ncbi:MAG: YihA family ribosome biogenesis GTP-binding protein, partial [Sulfurimonas sp.]|nr:YihA family ribosome biogenesis GTP-binding protein [Sulfurimonas sp.]
YISKRAQIKVFIHLVDCRHPFLEIDKSVSDFLLENSNESQYILQIFTKIDKLNQKEQNALRKEFPHAIMVSSSKKKGLPKVLKIIYDILEENNDEN